MKNCECGEESTVRFCGPEKQVCLCDACWELVKAQLIFLTRERPDLFELLNQARGQRLERGRVKEISADERAQWRNVWCILRGLDWFELEESGAEDIEGYSWPEFSDDPHSYLIKTDDAQADAIWRAVEKRLK